METIEKKDDIQLKLNELLKELTDICKNNGIVYTLYGYTGAGAIVNGEINSATATIMIDVADFKSFIKAVEKNLPENRAFDYMGNNKNYKSFSAHYSDTQTTYMPLGQNKNYYVSGLYVEILVLRHMVTDKIQRARLNVLEHGWEGTFKQPGMFTAKIYIFAEILMWIYRFFLGGTRAGKSVFKQLLRGYTGRNANGAYYVKPYNKRIIIFKYNPLSKLREIYMNDNAYLMTNYHGSFLALTYCQGWRKAALEQSIYNTKNIISADVPYTEMLAALENTDDIYTKYLKSFRSKWKHHSRFVKYDKYKKEAWLTAKRTGDRLELTSYYQPKMERIRQLQKNKDYYALSLMMKKHRNVMVRHLNRGEGFAVNKELFDIQMELFDLEGKKDIVKKLKAITPKVYMDSIG